MSNTAQPKPLVVVSSVSDDEEWLNAFQPHLDILGQYGDVDVWDENDIAAGSDRYREMDERMKSARIVICLISADYLSAIRSFESFDYLLEQRQLGGLLLLPILVRPCPWQIVPWLKRIKMFPRDNQPVSTHYQGREDEVFTEVVLDVYSRLETLETVRSVKKTAVAVAEAARRIVTEEAVPAPPAAAELPADVREDIQHLPETGHKLFGRTRELAFLDAAWGSSETNVISLIAWGGVGKSTLVNRWLERMRTDGYRGARRVFAWSFYSQGTKEQVTSSDLFFDTALRWFGVEGFEQLSVWDKAERLAGLIRQEPTLLVLDGVEPLQSGADFDRGVFRDGGLQWLLKELIRDNSGLCVVTSRVALADYQEHLTKLPGTLVVHDDGTIPAWPGQRAVQVDLETISPAAGRDLLKTEFVQGTNAELEQATREFGCHALAVSLLASWLHEIPAHHVSERQRIVDLDIPDKEGRHARRVLSAFEELLRESPELELLRIMGLFDRPANTALVESVLNGDPILGLTSHFDEDYKSTLTSSLAKCRRLCLLARSSEHRPDDVDCHPLIRDHFAAQLAEHHADAACEAHRRLYEHLKQSAPELPDNLNDMMLLYHAVAHGCKAELWEESWNTYLFRICRGQEAFAFRKLGAFGADLACTSGFFERQWNSPVNSFNNVIKGSLLGIVGFSLRSLGRLNESREPFEGQLNARIHTDSFEGAARAAINLSELSLTLGDVSSAVRRSEQSAELADRSTHAFERMTSRTTLADVLHAVARVRLAAKAFAEAEKMQKEKEAQSPLLYSIRGYKYCDLLLDELSTLSDQRFGSTPGDGEDTLNRELRQVRNRAETTLEWAKMGGEKGSLLTIALEQLTLGRTWLIEARMKADGQDSSFILPTSALDAAQQHLDESVALLRQAETQDWLPVGLLHRASLWRTKFQITNDKSQIDLAERDLSEAESIAERGDMLIFQIEAAMERTRLALARMKYEGGRMKEEMCEQARDKLEKARRLVRQTEKPYEPHVPDWDEWDPPEYVGVFKEGEIVGYHCRNDEIERLQKQIDSVKEQ